MNEENRKKWQDPFLYTGSDVNINEDLGVVYTIVHIYLGKAWVTPQRITRLHEHNLIGGRCYCMNDRLISTEQLHKAPKDL